MSADDSGAEYASNVGAPGASFALPGPGREPTGFTAAYHRAAAAALRTDKDLIDQFLNERCGNSRATAESYRSQLYRLAWYCRQIGLPSIRHLQRQAWDGFRGFLRNPPPDLVMTVSRPLSHPDYRPFRGALSAASAQRAEVVAKAFFSWMADPAIAAVEHNPVATLKAQRVARRSATRAGIERFLSDDDLEYVRQAIDSMPGDKPMDKMRRARASWLVQLALTTGLRASELASACHGDLRPSRQKDQWSLSVLRKGGVQSMIPVHPSLIAAYREYLALTLGDAGPSDGQPLVMSILGASKAGDASPGPAGRAVRSASMRPMTRQQVWRLVKEVTGRAALLAMEHGDTASQARLENASTHWLRHTFATAMLDDGADLRTVQTLLDHASLATTTLYAHRPDEALQADIRKLRPRMAGPRDGDGNGESADESIERT